MSETPQPVKPVDNRTRKDMLPDATRDAATRSFQDWLQNHPEDIIQPSKIRGRTRTGEQIRVLQEDQIKDLKRFQREREAWWKAHGGRYVIGKDGKPLQNENGGLIERVYPKQPPQFTDTMPQGMAEQIMAELNLVDPGPRSPYAEGLRRGKSPDEGKVLTTAPEGPTKAPSIDDYEYTALTPQRVAEIAQELNLTEDQVREFHYAHWEKMAKEDIRRRAFPQYKPGEVIEREPGKVDMRLVEAIKRGNIPTEEDYIPPTGAILAKLAAKAGLPEDEFLHHHKQEWLNQLETAMQVATIQQEADKQKEAIPKKTQKSGVGGGGIRGWLKKLLG